MKGRILLGMLCAALVFGLPTFHGLQAQTTQHGITLTWTAGVPAAGQVADASYNVYRSTITGGPYAQIGSAVTTTYTDSTGVGGTKYFYVITGTAPGAIESGFSNEVNAVFLAQAATPVSPAAASH